MAMLLVFAKVLELAELGTIFRDKDPLTFDCVAEMVVVPAAIAVTRPAPLTVAAEGADETHVAEAVKSCTVPSE